MPATEALSVRQRPRAQIDAHPSGPWVGFWSGTSSPGVEREMLFIEFDSHWNRPRNWSPLSLSGSRTEICFSTSMFAPFTPDREECERLRGFPVLHLLRGLLPRVGRSAVGDQEDPRPVEGDPVRAIGLLAKPRELDPARDRGAHRRVAEWAQPGRLEDARGLELGRDVHGTEGDAGHLDPLRRQLVGEQLVAKGLEPFVQLRDRLAGHRPGDVEQEQARASRLGVEREVVGSEGLLGHGSTSLVVAAWFTV